MKRTLSLVLALVMVLGSFGAAFAEHADTADKVEAGAFLEAVGVLEGDEEGDLMLDETLLRRDMVILLSRLMGEEETAKDFPAESLTFEDITDDFYNGYIAWSVNNGLIEGHSETVFGFNENVTAQQYVTVLMRALGYSEEAEDYDAALETAKELGLCEGLELENDDQVVRGQMAVMTLNTLATQMKDSEVTLAEDLGIELPEPEVVEATEVENVYADNLKEIVVEFDGQVEKDSAELEVNYSLDKGEIKKAVLNEDMTEVVLTVEDHMENQKERELTVRNIKTEDGKLNTQKVEFTPVDRAVPEVLSVEGLGDKAVKVTFTEPVDEDTVKSSNFKIDDKTFVGTIDKDDTEVVILKLYRKLSEGTHEIEIKGIEDFAGYLMVTTEMEFEVVEDNEAPEIESVDATLEYVTVTFTEPVQDSSVRGGSKAYWKATESTSVKNKSAYDAERISDDTYKFDFTDKALPGYSVYLYVEGVKDYSDNTIAKDSPVLVNAEIDQTRPEVVYVEIDNDDSNKEIVEVRFSKSIDNIDDEDNYKILDEDNDEVRIRNIKSEDNDKTAKIVLYRALKKGTYTLELEGLQDKTVLKNTIIPYTFDFEVGNPDRPDIDSFSFEKIVSGSEESANIYIKFSREMEVDGEKGVGNPDNYFITYKGAARDLPADTEIEVFSNGKSVIIRLPNEIDDKDFDYSDLDSITVMGVEDIDGKKLAKYSQTLEKDSDKDKELNILEANLVDTKTIEMEFSQIIQDINDSKVTLDGASVEDYELDGEMLIIRLKDDLYSPANLKFTASKGAFELLTGGESPKITDWSNFDDEVSPELADDQDSSKTGDQDEFTVTTTPRQFTIKFTEDIATDNQTAYNAILDIERVAETQDAKELKPSDIKSVKVINGDTLEVTLEKSAFAYKDGNKTEHLNKATFIVSLDKGSLIEDLYGNSANSFSGIPTAEEVTNPQD